MAQSTALKRYLERHIERALPPCPTTSARWQNTLVIPAYRESPELLTTLTQLSNAENLTLIILVLNRPDSDTDETANIQLRSAVKRLRVSQDLPQSSGVFELAPGVELFLLDLEQTSGALPANAGVGLARKTGFDLAIKWIAEGGISGQWICSGDADALLPADYFERLQAVDSKSPAAVFPFRHVPADDKDCNTATALYELRLHHYVLGLESAGSPYAMHTLGSCLAVRALAYTQVRGFPQRSGGEDFYLLNKLAKIGPITRLNGACVRLQSRVSQRAPFGTGPAVHALMAAENTLTEPVFYHPQCYRALTAVLAAVPALAQTPMVQLSAALLNQELDAALAEQCQQALEELGLDKAVTHCRTHSKNAAQFQKHFHQWFDGFRTLKLIHALRDGGWPQQNLQALASLEPDLWPPHESVDIDIIRDVCQRHWAWH